MEQCIDKNSAEALPRQLRNILAAKIASGEYRAGQRLEAIRKLANAYNVSAMTVVGAMEMLEKDGLVVRIAARGIFVNDAGMTEPVRKILFAAPIESISLELLSPEIWAIDSELYRGMMTMAAHSVRAEIVFAHFKENPDELEWEQQLSRLPAYDGAIFAGRQLAGLQEAAARVMPVIQIHPEVIAPPSGVTQFYYRQEDVMDILGAHIAECGYRSAGILSVGIEDRQFYRLRAAKFRDAAARYGVVTPPRFDWELPDTGKFREILNDALPDFIFFNHTETLVDFYRVAMQCGKMAGRDFGLALCASGFTFRGLLPTPTFIPAPFCEMGQNAVAAILRKLRHPEEPMSPQPVRLKLHAGESTGQWKATNIPAPLTAPRTCDETYLP